MDFHVDAVLSKNRELLIFPRKYSTSVESQVGWKGGAGFTGNETAAEMETERGRETESGGNRRRVRCRDGRLGRREGGRLRARETEGR